MGELDVGGLETCCSGVSGVAIGAMGVWAWMDVFGQFWDL